MNTFTLMEELEAKEIVIHQTTTFIHTYLKFKPIYSYTEMLSLFMYSCQTLFKGVNGIFTKLDTPNRFHSSLVFLWILYYTYYMYVYNIIGWATYVFMTIHFGTLGLHKRTCFTQFVVAVECNNINLKCLLVFGFMYT